MYDSYSAASSRVVGRAGEGPAKDQLVDDGVSCVELLDHAQGEGWVGEGDHEAEEEGEGGGGEFHGGGLVVRWMGVVKTWGV